MENDSSIYLIRQDIRKAQLWQGGGPLLGRLDMELAERCNNNCIHCYINQPADDRDLKNAEMSFARVVEILKEAAGCGCLEVRFTGGDPLLRDDFADIYMAARKLGITVGLFTNATLINRKLAELFKRYPPGQPVEVSLYGMGRESYESVSRVPGSFDAAMAGVGLLEQCGIRFRIKGVCLAGYPNQEKEMEAFAREKIWCDNRVSFAVFLSLRARGDNRQKNEQIRRLRLSPEQALAVLAREPDKFAESQKAFAEKFMGPSGSDLFSCGCGRGGAVDAYGRLQPCLLMRHPDIVYDLADGSILDALERFFPEMRKMQAADADYLDTCARCFLHGLCEQCPAHSWMEHGRLDERVKYFCDVAHAQARWLGLIKDGENAWEVVDWRGRVEEFVQG
jgi:radical SAM protein with 4Fe4S-binding SPASM domain